MKTANQPIKIVYFIGQLGLGGSEKQLYLLLKHMDGARFERYVVVFNPSPNYTFDDDLRRAGVAVYAIPKTVRSIPQRVVWLYRLLRTVRPDIVHSWSVHDNAYAAVVGRLAGIPIRLGSIRGALDSPDFREMNPLFRWLILHGVQGHLVNAESIAEQLHTFGVPESHIHFQGNCVEAGFSDSVERLNGFPAGSRLVGMVANFRREKNHRMFIRGLARVLDDFDDVYGSIVGQPVLASDPDVPEQIEEELRELGVCDRIQISGFHANVRAILPNYSVFCLTSDSEGTPNAILEAMSAGLPVISTRVGGIPRIVQDGITGILVAPGDVSGFTSALRDLLAHPKKARQMGVAGRERVLKEFSPQAIVPAFEAYYFSQIHR